MYLTSVWDMVTWTEEYPGRDVCLVGENIGLVLQRKMKARHLDMLSHLHARYSCGEPRGLSRRICAFQSGKAFWRNTNI